MRLFTNILLMLSGIFSFAGFAIPQQLANTVGGVTSGQPTQEMVITVTYADGSIERFKGEQAVKIVDELNPSATICEGNWTGSNEIDFNVVSQTKIDPFNIVFRNLGFCSKVELSVSPVIISGKSFNINLAVPTIQTGSVSGTFSNDGNSVSGSFTFSQNSCGSATTSGSWSGSPDTPCSTPPTANFSGSPTSGSKPLTVQFNDQSSGDINSRSWNFGDGGSSTSTNPSHTYNNAGTYTVKLTVTGPGGSNTKTRNNYITVIESAPTANFNGSPTSGNKPLTVQFNDQSSGDINSRSWNFGDGGSSTSTNPSHTYNNAGTYTVALTVTGPGGSNTKTRNNYITVTESALTANFNGSPTSGNKPLTVQFNDQSSGDINSRSWNFGDGGSSTSTNPSHTYNNAGTYTVALTVTGPGGSNTQTRNNYITVTESAPTANFNGSPTSGNKPLTVQFSDQSSGNINSRSWNFGDGGSSSQQNPSHIYNNAGSYTVSLTVTGPDGSNTKTRTGYIAVAEPGPTLLPGEYPTDENTVLLLHMNETSGSFVADSSGRGNHGMAEGTTIVDGRFGKARRFDSDESGEWVTVTDHPSLNFGAGDFTVEAWVNTNYVGASHGIVVKGVTGTHYEIGIGNESGIIGAPYLVFSDQSDNDFIVIAGSSINDGNWHHIAGVRRGATAELYVDGILEGTEDQSQVGSTDNASALIIDGLPGSVIVDEVRISNKARRQDEFNLAPPAFTKVTAGNIANDEDNSSGASWGDYDADGDLDLHVANGGSDRLYRNNGDGTFTSVTGGVFAGDGSNSRASSWGDYDNDGDLDLFVANCCGELNFLFANDGDGSFTRITAGVIVNDEDARDSFGGSWVDYDNDGDLDLFVADNPTNLLYANDGEGTFTKITSGAIVNEGTGPHGAWGDFDNDGDLDLFATGSPNNLLYRNNGDGSFTKKTTGPVVNNSVGNAGGSWGDYDNDGDLDLFVTAGFGSNRLYTNNGDGTFIEVTTGDIADDVSNSWGSSWGDYDNDGDLDLFVARDHTNEPTQINFGQDNLLYLNDGEGNFSRITSGQIVNDDARSPSGFWGDFDNDGHLDLFVANNRNENNFLYHNKGNSNHWTNVQCVGTLSNTTAIGAKVRIKATIKGKPVWQLREISGQTGYGGQNSLNAEFGLGDATVIDSLKIEWPSGIVQVLTNVAVDQFLVIEEDVETAVEEPLSAVPQRFALSQNYPNPFNPQTSIQYQLPETGQVKLVVYNLAGRLVATLVNDVQSAGVHTVQWNGKDFHGREVASGIYLYRLETEKFIRVNKLALIR